MTTEQHPITPPPELVQQWSYDWHRAKVKHVGCAEYIATQAARWGANQELEACCQALFDRYVIIPTCIPPKVAEEMRDWLRAARRPKPPSLKKQALTQLDSLHADLKAHGLGTNTDTVRRALEQLDG